MCSLQINLIHENATVKTPQSHRSEKFKLVSTFFFFFLGGGGLKCQNYNDRYVPCNLPLRRSRRIWSCHPVIELELSGNSWKYVVRSRTIGIFTLFFVNTLLRVTINFMKCSTHSPSLYLPLILLSFATLTLLPLAGAVYWTVSIYFVIIF